MVPPPRVTPPHCPLRMAAFVTLLLLFLLGILLRRLRLLPQNAAVTLNSVILTICLPAAVLRHVPALQLDHKALGVAVLPWLLAVASVPLVLLTARLAGWSRDVTGALLLLVPLGNTSFLGYPLVQALLGGTALGYAVLYDQFGSSLILSSYGLLVLAWYGGGARPTPWHLLRRVLSFPPFIALLLALTVFPAHPPAWIADALARLDGALLPLAALVIGLQFTPRLPSGTHLPLLFGLVAKLLLLPLLALLLAPWLGLHGAAWQASVLESAMPTMITAAALASSRGLAPSLSAALAGFGVPLALLSLPLWARWLGA